MSRPAPIPTRPSHQPELVLTGHALRGRFLAYLGDQPVRLSSDQMELLAILVRKRLSSDTGRVGMDDVIVSTCQHLRTKVTRLRRQFTEVLGSSVGEMLIQNGTMCSYFLNLDRHAIRIDRSCLEIPKHETCIDWAQLIELANQSTSHAPIAVSSPIPGSAVDAPS